MPIPLLLHFSLSKTLSTPLFQMPVLHRFHHARVMEDAGDDDKEMEDLVRV